MLPDIKNENPNLGKMSGNFDLKSSQSRSHLLEAAFMDMKMPAWRSMIDDRMVGIGERQGALSSVMLDRTIRDEAKKIMITDQRYIKARPQTQPIKACLSSIEAIFRRQGLLFQTSPSRNNALTQRGSMALP